MALARKATVVSHKSGALAVGYISSGVGGPVVPRPFVGGLSSGFHTVPQAGDQVLTLYESADNPYPIQTLSTTDTPNLLPSLSAGESEIKHPDGRTASGLFNTGISRIFRTANGIGADITHDQIANQLIADVGSGSTLLMSDNAVSFTAGFGSSPGVVSLQVSPAATGKINLVGNIFASLTPQATANFGTLSVGSGAFDGSSAGHYVGVAGALGTVIAANAATGFLGGLIDLQLAGASKFSVNVSGNTLLSGTLGVGGDVDLATHNIKNVGFISDGASAGAGNWSIDSTGLVTANGGITLGNQIKSGGGGAPTYTASANTTSATVTGNDTVGKVVITTKNQAFNAQVFYDMGTLNFHDAHGTAPIAVLFTWVYNGSGLASISTLGNPNTPPTSSGFKLGLNVVTLGATGIDQPSFWYFVIW